MLDLSKGNQVFRTDWGMGEYLTYPDGDKATMEEIIAFETQNELKRRGL